MSNLLPPHTWMPPSSNREATVVIVDDNVEMRELLRMQLTSCAHLIVVAEAGDGRTGELACAEYRPDIVILDLSMPGMDGLDALQSIKSISPSTRVVVHTSLLRPGLQAQAMRLGADEYVVKGSGRETLLAALDRLCSPSASKESDHPERLKNIAPWHEPWPCPWCTREHVVGDLASTLVESTRHFYCPSHPHTPPLLRIRAEGSDYQVVLLAWRARRD